VQERVFVTRLLTTSSVQHYLLRSHHHVSLACIHAVMREASSRYRICSSSHSLFANSRNVLDPVITCSRVKITLHPSNLLLPPFFLDKLGDTLSIRDENVDQRSHF
jgi:hypothetical protein